MGLTCIFDIQPSNSVTSFGAKAVEDRELKYMSVPYLFKLSDSSQ